MNWWNSPIRNQLLIRCSLIVLFWSGSLVQPLAAQQISGNGVNAGKDAFRRSARYPWYERQTAGIRRLNVKTPPDIAGSRDSRWTPGKPRNFNWNFNFLGQLMRGIMYVLLATLLIALIIVVARAASHSQLTEFPDSPSHGFGFDASRVEKLPFQLEGGAVDLLPMAKQFRDQGDFRKAIIYLFSYKLLRLDQERLIRLAKGKTNRQYLRELRTHRPLRSLVELTMVAFEDVFFGEHDLDRQRFESCWSSLDKFHRLAVQEVTT